MIQAMLIYRDEKSKCHCTSKCEHHNEVIKLNDELVQLTIVMDLAENVYLSLVKNTLHDVKCGQ